MITENEVIPFGGLLLLIVVVCYLFNAFTEPDDFDDWPNT